MKGTPMIYGINNNTTNNTAPNSNVSSAKNNQTDFSGYAKMASNTGQLISGLQNMQSDNAMSRMQGMAQVAEVIMMIAAA